MDYISSQNWDKHEAEIFIGLKDGSLESLVRTFHTNESSTIELAQTAVHHMLQALDFLAHNNIIHRDAKPANILYTKHSDKYHFQLGDFGLSNELRLAATRAGTPLYMAPEIYRTEKQTNKADVWSLFVTMLWVLDVNGFRKTSDSDLFTTYKDVQDTVVSLASRVEGISAIREMAAVDVEGRASAAQMLIKLFSGEGLTTPRRQIPPLASCPPDGKSQATAVPTPVARPAQLIWRPNPPATAHPPLPGYLRQFVSRPSAAGPAFRIHKRQVNRSARKRTPAGHQIPGSFPDDTDTS